MTQVKKILTKWEKDFNVSSYVRINNGEECVDVDFARQMYFGGQEHEGFKQFYDKISLIDQDEAGMGKVISTCISYLSETGIHLDQKYIIKDNHDIFHTGEWLLKKTNFILFALSTLPAGNVPRKPFSLFQNDLEELAEKARKKNIETKTGDTEPNRFNAYVTIPENYLADPEIKALYDNVEKSNENFFITGKAGTGKSTFLHFLKQESRKNIVVTAYTGIAAINVGGVTIHSFFGFPFKPMMPRDPHIHQFSKGHPKRKLIEKMETLVIDEVSMVNADVLEAIDYSLRINGGDPTLPFGGKQILLFGDIFQLPPVRKTADHHFEQVYKDIYKSGYFFDAPVFKISKFNFVELAKVHRQKDEKFKSILNHIRTGNVNREILDRLNSRCIPGYSPSDDEFVLTLTTTNRLANSINIEKLKKLQGDTYTYSAITDGNFPRERFPTEEKLELKEDAQVIFIRNDMEKKWVNGTIGKIYELGKDYIKVMVEDEKIFKLEMEEWENKTYLWDDKKKQIQTEVLGTFKQYPIKLAWAVTIHKSQGLTFQNLLINLGSGAFAHGQVYVALSRCRTLDGITLLNRVQYRDIIIDKDVLKFFEKHFVLNDQYRDCRENIEFLLHHSDRLLQMLTLHYPFTDSQISRYKTLLDKANKSLENQQPLNQPYDVQKFSKKELAEIFKSKNNLAYISSEEFYRLNFGYMMDDEMVENLLDFLKDLDDVVKLAKKKASKKK